MLNRFRSGFVDETNFNAAASISYSPRVCKVAEKHGRFANICIPWHPAFEFARLRSVLKLWQDSPIGLRFLDRFGSRIRVTYSNMFRNVEAMARS